MSESWGESLKNYRKYQYSCKERVYHSFFGFSGSAVVLYLFYQSWVISVIGGCLGAVGYLVYRKRILAEKQCQQLMVEFKDVMDSMVSALVAGYSMENAVTEAYHDLMLLKGKETPMLEELEQMKQKLKLQHPLDELLLDLGRRSGVEDMITFAQIYATARRSGGNLVKIMKRTSENIGEKMEIQREIQTMIAGKKMEATCMTIIPLFIILYLQVCSPGFLNPLYGNLMGVLFMSVTLVLYIVGVIWSRHIMNISC